ncbi:MAG: hypothetical protein K8T90_01700 [Planctomycetes bacterium]|nr:hypothetical protein [Planctomycetota bacterium]
MWYTARDIPRLRGASPILKIGRAEDPGGLQQQFNNYKHQDLVTVGAPDLVGLLRGGRQTTNAMLMYFLAHWAGGDPVVVDL